MKEYVVSNNPNRLNLKDYFLKSETVLWKQISKADISDYVYIYVGRPEKRLMYKCIIEAIDLDITDEIADFYKKPTKCMMLRLVKKLPEKGLDLGNLLNNGLKTVQCATEVSDELHDYFVEIGGVIE